MKIDHIGLYVSDLDAARAFFEKYFCVTANEKYTNPKKSFASHMLTFADGARLEIMTLEGIDGQKTSASATSPSALAARTPSIA